VFTAKPAASNSMAFSGLCSWLKEMI